MTPADVLISGLCEENRVQTPAFTDAVRLYRQAQGNYGTWDMMCGLPSQVKPRHPVDETSRRSDGDPFRLGWVGPADPPRS